MSRFVLTPEAAADLDAILEYVERESGEARANRVHDALLREVGHVADHPGIGHARPDLTRRNFRVLPVHSLLIVYRPETIPLEVVAFMHGARDPADLRDRIGEQVLGPEHYVAVSLIPDDRASLALARLPGPE